MDTHITITSDTPASLLLGVLRADETFSDVQLVFAEEKVLTAHAVVLASTSTNRKFLRTSQVATTQSKAILNHHHVDFATANVVLDYMYTDTALIPPSLIFSVITFADEILVSGLVDKCAEFLVNGKIITSENALEFYVLCEKIQILRKYRSFALDVVLEDLYPALESGREFLVQMDKDEVEMLLLFDHFSPLDPWKILIAWCKSHLSSDISLDRLADLPDASLHESAIKLIEPVLPAVDLFKMGTEDLKYVAFYCFWLPEVVQDLLLFRTRATTPSGVNEWKPEHQTCITDQEVKNILAAVKCHLPQRLRSNCARATPSLLFHAKPAGFSNEQFHATCDDRMNTLTVIQIKNGCIIGGFVDNRWSSGNKFIPCETAFLFIMAPNGTIRLLSCKNKEEAIFSHRAAGPTFGSQDLMVHKTQVTAFLDRYELFGSLEEGETCRFVESLCTGAVGVGEIEDYKEPSTTENLEKRSQQRQFNSSNAGVTYIL
ncbi:hypothetical protein HDU81_002267 [Chytriomyces hyalinus]|nr:hypothetical protein HDU81_002267 [Chytriomyces hyalinus]